MITWNKNSQEPLYQLRNVWRELQQYPMFSQYWPGCLIQQYPQWFYHPSSEALDDRGDLACLMIQRLPLKLDAVILPSIFTLHKQLNSCLSLPHSMEISSSPAVNQFSVPVLASCHWPEVICAILGIQQTGWARMVLSTARGLSVCMPGPG